jgi:hypothetical protein
MKTKRRIGVTKSLDDSLRRTSDRDANLIGGIRQRIANLIIGRTLVRRMWFR